MRRSLFTFLSVVGLLATGLVAGYAAGGGGTVDPPPRIAFLANGVNPADALAAGGIAGQLGAPLFTTNPATLEDAARDAIVAYAPDLVIALGGPVALSDDILLALSQATGLAISSEDNPRDGIIRVVGDNRYATAAAVADLLVAYNPAYLPVGATALGALDADTAGDADTLGGSSPAAFQPAGDYALADQTCGVGEVVTGIAADGTPVCATDRVGTFDGDADTLDGLDSTDLQPAGDYALATDLDGYALADRSCTAGQVVTGIAGDGTPTCAADAIDGGDADTLDGLNSTAWYRTQVADETFFPRTPSATAYTFDSGATLVTNETGTFSGASVTVVDECKGPMAHDLVVTISGLFTTDGALDIEIDGQDTFGNVLQDLFTQTDSGNSTPGRQYAFSRTFMMLDIDATLIGLDEVRVTNLSAANLEVERLDVVAQHAGWTCGAAP